jgi:Tol biopolymer transport system component
MKGKIKVLGLVMILGLATAVLMTGAPGWAQKGKPKPPGPSADPAIAYVKSGFNPDFADLMIMNADGSNNVALVSQKFVSNGSPDWSPNGKQLVFTDNAVGGWHINIINVDGTGRRRMGFVIPPSPVAWSPDALGDGKFKIAYFDWGRDPDGTIRTDYDVYIVNVDGTDIRQLANTPNVNEGPFGGYCELAWSYDAKYLAVAMYNNILVYEIAYDPETDTFSVAKSGYVISDDANVIDLSDIDWANHSYRLVYADYDLAIASLVDAETLTFKVDQLTLFSDIHERGPSWSPDDSQIVYARYTAGGIWIMNADGSGDHQITARIKGANQEQPQWRRNIY